MIEYKDLKKIAQIRRKEAEVLYANGYYDGAAYLCGYVIEIALKARICKHLGLDEYPDDGQHKSVFSSHDFSRLLLLSGLDREVSIVRNKDLFDNWSILTSWTPQGRYKKIGSYNKEAAKEMLEALTKSNVGFFKWIQTKW